MGAHSFQQDALGRDVGAAYVTAVSEAEYDYGHDPYNGTISTTRGFALVERPPSCRLSTERLIDLVWQAHLGEEKKVPIRLRGWAIQTARQIEKWGPALALELTPTEARELRRRWRRSGTRDRAFVFFGLAAS